MTVTIQQTDRRIKVARLLAIFFGWLFAILAFLFYIQYPVGLPPARFCMGVAFFCYLVYKFTFFLAWLVNG